MSSATTRASERFEELQASPPSVKLVYLVLKRQGPLTQTELGDETLLPDRTVRYALSRLKEADVVESEVDLSDPRQRVYTLKPVDEAP